MPGHTDIKQKSWISIFPSFLQPYAYLARLDRPIGVWLLLLPGWWAILLAAGGFLNLNTKDWQCLALFAIGAIIMRAAGCVINDYWDRDIDKEVERTSIRPLAAGTIRPWQAFIFLGLLLSGGLMILLQLQPTAILLGVMVMPLIILYPLMKRITWWPQAFLGITFNFAALIGWAAIAGVLSLPALALYASAIFWTLGYDTIYAHQDKEDDARIGIKSTALKFGENSKKWVRIFYILSFILLLISFISAKAGIISILFLIPAAVHLMRQLKIWDIDNPESSLKIFKSNRNYGLLIALAALV